jgi:DNA-binding protein HU-beta
VFAKGPVGVFGQQGEAIDGILEAVTSNVTRGDIVQLVGFRSFSTAPSPSGQDATPGPARPSPSLPRKRIEFTAGKSFKDSVNAA